MNLDQAFQSELLKLGHDRTIEWAIQDELRKLGWDFKDDEPSRGPVLAVEKCEPNSPAPDKPKPVERIEKKAISAVDLGPKEGKLPQPTPGEPDQPSAEQGRKKTWKRLGMLADDVVLTAKNILHDWHGRV